MSLRKIQRFDTPVLETSACLPYWRCALLVLAAVFFCIAEEYVGSHISKETRWTAEEGPYILERDLVIDKKASLTIGPGVKVIIRKPKLYDTVPQFDATDSVLVSIKVNGALSCIGKRDTWISFVTQTQEKGSYGWYGIIFDSTPGNFAEIAFTEIVNAYRAVSVKQSDPLIRNCILTYNHIGIYCSVNGNARIYNNVLARNLLSGIHVREANPHIANNIIVFNKNNGVICDGKSKINFEYNCVFGNSDGDFFDCTPELGIIVPGKKKGALPQDIGHNIYMDPVFKGSPADSLAVEHDVSLPTDKSRIKDTSLANVYYEDKQNSTKTETESVTPGKKYELSSYSPCIGNGLASEEFKNVDKSRNTMGIWGGPDYFVSKGVSSDVQKKSTAKPKKTEKKEGEKKKHGGH